MAHQAPSLPNIVHAPDLALDEAERRLLREAFAGYQRLEIAAELGGGFSGSRLLLIHPQRGADDRELPAVLKLDLPERIQREYQAYQDHIRGRLSGVPEVWGPPVVVGDRAGLRYSLVGAGLFPVASLNQILITTAEPQLVQVLEGRLLVQLGYLWQQAQPRESSFRDCGYARLLRPERLRQRLAEAFAAAPLPGPDGPAGGVPDLDDVLLPDPLGGAPLPNPLLGLDELLDRPRRLAIGPIHGDLNLDNILVDPEAGAVRLIDFHDSRRDHVLHDLLRLETGILTRSLPALLPASGPEPGLRLLLDLLRAPDQDPADARLRGLGLALLCLRRAAGRLAAGDQAWRDYLEGLALYLLGALKFRNLDDGACRLAFWAAAQARREAGQSPAAWQRLPADLEAALALRLARNPALEAYRRRRIHLWSDPQREAGGAFARLSLLQDQGEEAMAGRWQAGGRQYDSLDAVLTQEVSPAYVLLGPPGSGKSSLLRHLDLSYAQRGLADPKAPLVFLTELNAYLGASGAEEEHPAGPALGWLARRWQAFAPELEPLPQLMRQGRIVLLLDGLNELPHQSQSEYRRKILEWRRFLAWTAGEAPACRLVFTCRSLDYSAPLSSPQVRVPQLRIEALDDEAIRAMVARYGGQGAEALWRRLAGSPLLNLVRNPFLLRLLIEVEQRAGAQDLPAGQAALITAFLREALRRELEREHPAMGGDRLLSRSDQRRLTLGRWAHAHALPDDGYGCAALTRLALGMQAADRRDQANQLRLSRAAAVALSGLDADDAETLIQAGLALAVLDEDPADDGIGFFHQRFQEYFAARGLAATGSADLASKLQRPWRQDAVQPGLAEVCAALNPADPLPPAPSSGWEESAAMAVAMSQEPGELLVAIAEADLALAGRIAAEADVAPRLAATQLEVLRQDLITRAEQPQADLRVRIACGQALGCLGDPRLKRREGSRGPYLLPPMVAIPAGSYPLGSDDPGAAEDARPRHQLHLPAFRLGRFAVTNGEWRCFMAAGGYDEGAWWPSAEASEWLAGGPITAEGWRHNWRQWWQRFQERPERLDGMGAAGQLSKAQLELWRELCALDEQALEAYLADRFRPQQRRAPRWWSEDGAARSCPVVGLTFYEAQAYCLWLGAQSGRSFRLPSEAEWEAAAQDLPGEDDPAEPGDAPAPGLDLRCNAAAAHLRATTPVGIFPRSRSARGIDDLRGNSFDWTLSLYGRWADRPDWGYPYRPDDGREDPGAPAAQLRVARGGSFVDRGPALAPWYRYPLHPALPHRTVGLRLAESVA